MQQEVSMARLILRRRRNGTFVAALDHYGIILGGRIKTRRTMVVVTIVVKKSAKGIQHVCGCVVDCSFGLLTLPLLWLFVTAIMALI